MGQSSDALFRGPRAGPAKESCFARPFGLLFNVPCGACLPSYADRSAPKKHNDVIRQFGSLVKDCDAGLQEAGDGLNEVWDLRVTADYRDTSNVSSADASEALQRASGFLDLCKRQFCF